MNTAYLILLCSIPTIILLNQENMIQESKSERKSLRTEWTLSDLMGKAEEGVLIKGNPGIVSIKSGEAVSFNGSSDAIYLESMPLAGLEQFTIELIFQPFSGGNFEQRYLHIGEVQGDRILMELRSTESDWYFDAFIKSGDQQCALIDSSLLHPLDQWYHIAFVIDHGKLESWVDGKKELEGLIVLAPLKGDKISIGVRQNEVSWFKGAIYKIRITPYALKPQNFMQY